MKRLIIGLLGIVLGIDVVLANPGRLVSFDCELVSDRLLEDIVAGYSKPEVQETASDQKIILWDEAKSRTTRSGPSKELRIEVSY